MHKIAMLTAIVALLLALGAGAVFAQEEQQAQEQNGTLAALNNQVIQCHGVPCEATGSKDLVYERVGNGKHDRILLRGGDDKVVANTYRHDKDIIKGNTGFDLIYVDDNDRRDRIFGGAGDDKCYVDARSEIVGGCSVVIVR